MTSGSIFGHKLETLAAPLAIVRLAAGAGLPWWAAREGDFLSFTRTPDETSIVCEARHVPEGVEREGPYRALRLVGVFSLESAGILAFLAVPLTAARVPIFVVATHDTDYILVPADRLALAIGALREAGHSVDE